MNKKTSKMIIRYSVVFLIGLLMFFMYIRSRGLFSVRDKLQLYMILSDGFVIPGFIILGIGCMLIVANAGVFDMASYTMGKIKSILRSRYDDSVNYPKTYFDYKLKYSGRKVQSLPCVLVGILFVLLSMIFNYLYLSKC